MFFPSFSRHEPSIILNELSNLKMYFVFSLFFVHGLLHAYIMNFEHFYLTLHCPFSLPLLLNSYFSPSRLPPVFMSSFYLWLMSLIWVACISVGIEVTYWSIDKSSKLHHWRYYSPPPATILCQKLFTEVKFLEFLHPSLMECINMV